MKTKLLSLFVALICASSLFASDTQVDGIWYDFDSSTKTATVTYRGSSYDSYSNEYTGSVVIPETVTYNSTTYSVTTIGDQAFYKCTGLTSVTIPNSVTTIGSSAFNSCTSLTSVTIPNSVTMIRGWAFYGCEGLTSVTIPNSVTTIGERAFYGCSGLTAPVYNVNCFAYMPRSYIGEYIVPQGIKKIVDSAFSGCSSLTSITIPNSVTWIGWYAFEYCTGLTSITISNSVTTISRYAFRNCSSLTSITIPNSVTTIEEGAFDDCSCDVFMEATTPPYLQCDFNWRIKNIYVPCGTMEAYQTAWQDYASRIKYAPYPSYVITKKSENGTIKTTTTDFTICDEPLVICTAKPDRGCFFVRWADGNTDNPRTIELIQDTTLEAIFDYQLTDKCGKDSALTWTLDKSTMALNITGTGALSENYTYGTFIESLTINNEITSIGQDAFYGCNNLKNVIIGSSVKVLEESAFYGCSAIKTITCYSQRPPTVNNYALYGLDYGTIVYVPADYLNTYKMHDAWGLYDVRPLGAKNVETTEVTTSTTSNDVTITWPITDGTDTYTLTITKNGEVICVLIFNANGQLTNIAFAAPGHNGAHQAPAATLTAQGYQFTVTGLNPGTAYDYSVTATDAGGKTLAEHKGNFSTTGGESSLESVHGSQPTMHKYFHNGNLIIERNGVKYTPAGQKVR